jgi:ribonuclease J
MGIFSAAVTSGHPSTNAPLGSLAALESGALRIVPLGGLGEIGMNCLAFEHKEGIVIVDCGVTFPQNDLGIDLYHPRFDYLLERSDRVLGVVITHGHEDHIGGLPYLLDLLDVPVYGPAHSLELVRQRLDEHRFDLDEIDLIEAFPRRPFQLGPFSIEPIRVTHSITEATALAVRSDAGLVIHTGDFKIDESPPDGEATDVARFEELGNEGVRLLLSDSTNVDSPGRARSEREVGEALHEIVAKAQHRVILGMFASNVQRLRMLGEIAIATKRRILLLGRSVQSHVRAAERVGKLGWPSDLLVPPELVGSTPRDKLLVIASGTQAERAAALTRLALGTHPALRLEAKDLVVMSSRVIPGNDRAVVELMGNLLRLGVELITRVMDPRVHASGHAHRDEQRTMIELTRPRAFVPLHGTRYHLSRHAELARDAGVDDVMVAENGECFELAGDKKLFKTGKVSAGRVATSQGEALSDEVIRERGQLGRAGIVVVALWVGADGDLLVQPNVIARGVLDPRDAVVLRGARSAVARAFGEIERRLRASDEDVAFTARAAARRYFEAETGGRPVILVTVARG